MKVTKVGLWTMIVLKARDADNYDLSALTEDDRQRVEELLSRVLLGLRSEQDLSRLQELLDEVADGNAIETLERVAMVF